MKNNRGFIQLPILFAAILILAAGTFYFVSNSVNHKQESQTASVVDAYKPQSNGEEQILGEQTAQQEQEATTVKTPEETSAGKKQVHKTDSISTPQEPKTEQSVITTPQQSEAQNQAVQIQPTSSPSPTSLAAPSSTLVPASPTPTPQPTESQQNITTPTPIPTLQLTGGGNVSLGTSGYKISWNTTYVSSCTASGDWSGEKNTAGDYILSFTQTGKYTYDLICIGNNGDSVSKNISVNVIDTRPKITFSFNGSESTTNTYTTTVGNVVRLGWNIQYSYGGKCTASGDWSGEKSSGNSENLTFDQAGTFNYTLLCVNGASGEQGTGTATVIVSP